MYEFLFTIRHTSKPVKISRLPVNLHAATMRLKLSMIAEPNIILKKKNTTFM
jgi:hypothetical protein